MTKALIAEKVGGSDETTAEGGSIVSSYSLGFLHIKPQYVADLVLLHHFIKWARCNL